MQGIPAHKRKNLGVVAIARIAVMAFAVAVLTVIFYGISASTSVIEAYAGLAPSSQIYSYNMNTLPTPSGYYGPAGGTFYIDPDKVTYNNLRSSPTLSGSVHIDESYTGGVGEANDARHGVYVNTSEGHHPDGSSVNDWSPYWRAHDEAKFSGGCRMTFKNASYDSRGKLYDLVINISDVNVAPGKNGCGNKVFFADFRRVDGRLRLLSWTNDTTPGYGPGATIGIWMKLTPAGVDSIADNIPYRFDFIDLDIEDRSETQSGDPYAGVYAESVVLRDSGFLNAYYMSSSYGGMIRYDKPSGYPEERYRGSAYDGDSDLSTVSTWAKGDAASNFLWRGSFCGTILLAKVPVITTKPSVARIYPSTPTKTPASQVVTSTGSASYTIDFSIPYTSANNQYYSASLTDTLSSYLSCSSATVSITRKDTRAGQTYYSYDSNWTTTKSGQTITLTARSTSYSTFGGDYRVTITAPVTNQASLMENGGSYYYSATYSDCARISNQATLKVDSETMYSDTVYAYVPRAQVVYHVSGTEPPDSYTPATYKTWLGNSYTAESPLTTSHRGYEFTGWKLGSITGSAYTSGTLNSSVTNLYGSWEYFGATVTYHVNKMPPDCTLPPGYEGIMGDTYAIEPIQTTSCPSWRFTGWWSGPNETGTIKSGSITLPRGSTDLYGVWKCASIKLTKTASPSTLADPKVGKGQIAYTFKLTNDGDDDLQDITLSDPLLGGAIELPKTSLAVGESMTVTVAADADNAYSITQADIDAGKVHNEATATGSNGVDTIRATDSEDVKLTHKPGIKLEKASKTSEEAAPGNHGIISSAKPRDPIWYAFKITNTGNTTLSEVKLTDERLGGEIALAKTTLAPGEVLEVGPIKYLIDQADIDAGEVLNSADVEGKDPDPDVPVSKDSDDNEVTVEQDPKLELKKEVTSQNPMTAPHAGDPIDYKFTITNIGNVTISDIALEDELRGITLNTASMKTTLAPGESTTATGRYILSQSVIDSGSIDNHATVEGRSPKNDEESKLRPSTPPDVSDDDDATVTFDNDPKIEVDKTSNVDKVIEPNPEDEITYTLTITNTGNVTLHDIDVRDTLFADRGNVYAGKKDPLAPGESDTVTLVYPITQKDIDLGQVLNHATVTAKDPDGDPTSPDEDDNTVVLDTTPEIDVKKTITSANPTTAAKAGDKVTYSFEITNTGHCTLSSINLADPLIKAGDLDTTGMKDTLAPRETTYASATYTLTQDDIDAGHRPNTATIEGTSPAPKREKVQDEDSADLAIERHPSLSLEKASDVDDLSAAFAGDTITYTFTILNTGNVTIKNIVLRDDKISEVPITLPKTVLGPGESMQATFTYELTQADIDAGVVYNHATVTGDDPTGTPTEADDDNTVTIKHNPSISLVKELLGDSEIIDAHAGDVVTYLFTITNTGNVTLTDIVLEDKMEGVVLDVSEMKTVLTPGESTTATGTYVLRQTDIDAGEVRNIAIVTSRPPKPGDPDVVGEDTEDLTTPSSPSIDLEKASDRESIEFAREGDIIRYTFTITNTGNTTLRNVMLYDEMLGGWIDLSNAKIILPPHLAADADDEAKKIIYMVGLTGNQDAVLDAAASGDLDDMIDGGAAVEEDGADANDAEGEDPDDQASDGEGTEEEDIPAGILLIPGSKAQITVVYNITQLDIYLGKIENHAFAGGDDPTGIRVEDDDENEVTATHHPAHPTYGYQLTVYKSSDPVSGSLVAEGDEVTYTLTAKNTGKDTVPFTHIRDYLPAGTRYVSASDGGVFVQSPEGIETDREDASTDQGNGYVEWVLSDIEPDSQVEVNYTVTVAPEEVIQQEAEGLMEKDNGGLEEDRDPSSAVTEDDNGDPSESITGEDDDPIYLDDEEVSGTPGDGEEGDGEDDPDDVNADEGPLGVVKANLPDDPRLPLFVRNIALYAAYTDDPGQPGKIPYLDEPGKTTNEVIFSTDPDYPAPAIINIEKIADPAPGSVAPRASVITYELLIRNDGGQEARDLYIRDYIDPSLIITSEDVFDGGQYHEDLRYIDWMIDAVGAGQTISVHFSALVDEEAPLGATITNQALYEWNWDLSRDDDPMNSTNIVEHILVEKAGLADDLVNTGDLISDTSGIPGKVMLAVLALWLCSGFAVSYVMRRRNEIR